MGDRCVIHESSRCVTLANVQLHHHSRRGDSIVLTERLRFMSSTAWDLSRTWCVPGRLSTEEVEIIHASVFDCVGKSCSRVQEFRVSSIKKVHCRFSILLLPKYFDWTGSLARSLARVLSCELLCLQVTDVRCEQQYDPKPWLV